MKKINIIQFLPYFPPHKGGVETVAEEIGKYWIKNDFGDVINIITDIDQKDISEKGEKIIYKGENIGYKKNGYKVLVSPSIEIINNFPTYKVWSKKYKLILEYLNEIKKNKNTVVITHTRFFLTTLIGGIFAKKNKLKWVHIEHGSDYVKLSSKFKTFVAFVYDQIFGKWIFKNANLIIPISNACKEFVFKLGGKKVKVGKVIYRGIELTEINTTKNKEIKIVFIGRLVKLKGVDDLIKAYSKANLKNKLIIIGDGEEKNNLEQLCKSNNIKNVEFLGYKDKNFIANFLAKNKCVLVNPSYQEGLPTSVIEGLFYKNIVVASNVGGTAEISDKNDLILFTPGNIDELKQKLILGIKNFNNFAGLSKKIISEKFNWEKNIKEYFKLLN